MLSAIPSYNTKPKLNKRDEVLKSASKYGGGLKITAYDPKMYKKDNPFICKKSIPASNTTKQSSLCHQIGNTKPIEKESDEMAGTDISHEDFIKSLLVRKYRPPLANFKPAMRKSKSLGGKMSLLNIRRPLHDPEEENALVLFSPPEMSKEELMRADKTKLLVHVVVDPLLGKVLRPHQREGVKFMYDRVADGLDFPPLQIEVSKPKKKRQKSDEEVPEEPKPVEETIKGFGCILADDMGLGKTLQCVTLMWTLVKQSKEMLPLVEKVIVVSPSSLVKNWANEVKKWLGNRVQTLPIESGSLSRDDLRKKLQFFMDQCPMRHSVPIMFISYESLRGHIDILQQKEIGMIICDEGHRLKNAENQTYVAINSLDCKRRVLLSGTPIQNDLLEYYSLVNFVNKGCLGDPNTFRRYFENPILRGRDSYATDEEQFLGETRLKELRKRF